MKQMIMRLDVLNAASVVLPDAFADVSLRQLLSFQAVADQGSFHGAADALDYTQSAISQHVASLESALGVRLFDRGRGRRTVTLTEAGELLLRHVTAISNRLQAARADLLAYAAGEHGTLRVGVYSSVGSKLLPAIAQRFGERWPGIEMELSEAPDQGLLDLIELGRLDLTFGSLPLPEGPFEAIELARDPWLLLAAKGSKAARIPPNPSLRTIAAQRLIGFRSAGSTQALERLMRSKGHEPEFVFRSEDNATVQAMAAAGLGVALMPILAVAPGDTSIVAIPTDLPPRRVALIWHRDRYRTPAARAFVEIARGVCVEHAAELGLPEPPEPAGILPASPTTA
jgi:DNA-binding transcriptional LysR family regulator